MYSRPGNFGLSASWGTNWGPPKTPWTITTQWHRGVWGERGHNFWRTLFLIIIFYSILSHFSTIASRGLKREGLIDPQYIIQIEQHHFYRTLLFCHKCLLCAVSVKQMRAITHAISSEMIKNQAHYAWLHYAFIYCIDNHAFITLNL